MISPLPARRGRDKFATPPYLMCERSDHALGDASALDYSRHPWNADVASDGGARRGGIRQAPLYCRHHAPNIETSRHGVAKADGRCVRTRSSRCPVEMGYRAGLSPQRDGLSRKWLFESATPPNAIMPRHGVIVATRGHRRDMESWSRRKKRNMTRARKGSVFRGSLERAGGVDPAGGCRRIGCRRRSRKGNRKAMARSF